AKCRAGHSRLRSHSTVAACDVSAPSAVSDCVSSSHGPDDKTPNGLPIGSRLRGLDRAGAATGINGGKQKLGPISKQGDRYLRRILVVGAHSILRRAKQNPEKYPWLTQLLARR